jgi:hypothetical protein
MVEKHASTIWQLSTWSGLLNGRNPKRLTVRVWHKAGIELS